MYYDSGAVGHELTVSSNSCSGSSLFCTQGKSYGTGVSLTARAEQAFVIQTSFLAGTDTSEFWLRIDPCNPQ